MWPCVDSSDLVKKPAFWLKSVAASSTKSLRPCASVKLLLPSSVMLKKCNANQDEWNASTSVFRWEVYSVV